jgi:hypothetical protein
MPERSRLKRDVTISNHFDDPSRTQEIRWRPKYDGIAFHHPVSDDVPIIGNPTLLLLEDARHATLASLDLKICKP